MVFIGDVHGRISEYRELLDRFSDKQTIQIGDMGLGFPHVHFPHYPAVPRQHRFIRGNHDDPQACLKHPNYLGACGWIEKHKLFYLSGGYSIDRALRIEGVSWWRNEELSYQKLGLAAVLFEQRRPRIMVSHEAPSQIADMILTGMALPGQFDQTLSRTAQALQIMFEQYRPEHWVFGHYHLRWHKLINGTYFHCLPELGVHEI